MKSFLFLSFIVFYYSCSYNKHLIKNSNLISIVSNSNNKIINLPQDTYFIESEIKLKSNTIINGNNSVLILNSPSCHLFSLQYLKNVTLKNFTIRGHLDTLYLKNYNGVNEKNIVSILNSEMVNIENITVSSHVYTPISIKNSNDISIKNIKIKKIGLPIPEKLLGLYSYDGIFIGADQLKIHKNFYISNCDFSSIGVNSSKDYLKYDGDGIQFQSPKEGMLENIKIINCDFKNCAARGIKAQAGSDITIENNKFKNCTSAIGITQASSVNNIKMLNNVIDSCSISFAFNHFKVSNNVFIEGNIVSNIGMGIRTSGGSIINNCLIKNNVFKNIQTCFMDVLIKNSVITENIIADYNLNKDPNYYMAILCANGSENLQIIDNIIEPGHNSPIVIYIQNDTKNISVIKNKFRVKNGQSNLVQVYSHSKDPRNKNIDNKIITQ